MSNFDDTNYQIFFDEARANYISGRYADAAATFEHLIQVSLKRNEIDNAVYFSYRAAGAWEKAGDEFRAMKVYKDLIFTLGNHVFNKTHERVKQATNPKEKAEALRVLLDVARLVDQGQVYEITKQLVEANVQLAQEHDRKISERKALLETSAELLRSIKAGEDMIRQLLKYLAEVYVESGHHALQTGGLDVEYVAAREYSKAADIYEEIEEYKTADALRKRAEELIQALN